MSVKKLKDIIVQLRIEKGLTQGELAKELGISKSTIGMWETGKRLPSPELYEQLADFFNVDIDYLYGRTPIRQKERYDEDGNLQYTLRSDESRLLDNYNLLNETGKEKAQDSVHDLTEIKRYRKDNKVTSFPVLNAAHERTDIDVTDEMLQYDDDIMDNDYEW